MQTSNLYKYVGENGTIVSPCLLPMEHTTMYRLVADEGQELYNASEDLYAGVIDTEDCTLWTKVEARPTEAEPVVE